jgi:hypothetical protein
MPIAVQEVATALGLSVEEVQRGGSGRFLRKSYARSAQTSWPSVRSMACARGTG